MSQLRHPLFAHVPLRYTRASFPVEEVAMQKLITPFVALVSLICVAATQAGPLPDKPHIYVEGSAEIEVAPDQMTITVGLEETNQKLAVAKEDVDERSRRLIKAVKDLGVAPEDLSTTALHVNPAYEYRGGEQVPLGTRVYRQVEITLRDLSKYTQLIAALVDAEISNTVSTQLEVSNQEALTDQALVAAVEDARKRARALANAAGKGLGAAWSVSQFDMRTYERHQVFAVSGLRDKGNVMQEGGFAARASEPFEPGMITASAQVYVVFLLK